MKEALETYYMQKIIPLHEKLVKENFSWNVIKFINI
jgi:hypothetical protein